MTKVFQVVSEKTLSIYIYMSMSVSYTVATQLRVI